MGDAVSQADGHRRGWRANGDVCQNDFWRAAGNVSLRIRRLERRQQSQGRDGNLFGKKLSNFQGQNKNGR